MPIGGGQWLTVGVQYRSLGASLIEGGSPERRHDCMLLVQMDADNGDIVQSPPHGRASKASAEQFPRAVIQFLHTSCAARRLNPTTCAPGKA